MSNTKTNFPVSRPGPRRVKLRPQLRFVDKITRGPSRDPTAAPEDDQLSSDEYKSICSDDVAPALSEGSSGPRSNTDARGFTAIFKVTEQVRAVADSLDIDALHSLAAILIPCLENILRSFKHLPSRIRSAPNFGVAFRGVIFSGRMFAQHIGNVTRRMSGIQLNDAIQLSLQSLDITMANLKVLFDLIEHSVTQGKPLPDVPVGSAADVTLTSLGIPETTVKGSSITATASYDHVSVPPSLGLTPEDGSDIPMPPATIAVTKASLRRLVSGLGRKSTLRPLTLWSGTMSSKPSAMALTLRVSGSPTDQVPTTTVAPGPSDISSCDQKARVGGAVPAPLNIEQPARVPRSFAQAVNVELPTLTPELYFSTNGVLCAASLAGLVRLLTSTEAVKDSTFDNLFFCSFRFFSKPIEIFNLLVEQYDEGPREPIDPAQAILLEQDAQIAKVRVAKVFLLWLRFHWRYQWDAEVLEPLRQFASTRPPDDPASITWNKVVRKLEDASGGVGYRGFRIQRTAHQMQLTHYAPISASTQFELLFREVITQGYFNKVDVLHFHSPTGREEFARQLCLAASELFRDIDPEDAVRYWTDEQNKTVGGKILRLASFDNALAYWTSNTIAARPTVRSRAEVMEFFIDTASRCVELRNFASGSAISSGISLCMTRLHETTEALSGSHKAMATELDSLFALHNRKSYRSTLALERGPTVPLMSTFNHNIEVSGRMRAVREHPEKSGNMLIDLERYRVISRTIQAMELCHARFTFERISYIHKWLQHVLLDYGSRTADENLCLLDNSSNRAEPKKEESKHIASL